MVRVLFALVLVAGCGNAPSTTPPPSAPSSSPAPASTTPPATPDHDACSTDSDCVIAAERDVLGCCIADPKPRSMSRAFVDWREARRAGACPTPCMSPPVPVALSACESTVRCVAGRCGDACP